MPTLKEFSKWKSIRDAYKETGYSRQAILNWAEDGKVRGIHTSIGWLLDPKAVEALPKKQDKITERSKA